MNRKEWRTELIFPEEHHDNRASGLATLEFCQSRLRTCCESESNITVQK